MHWKKNKLYTKLSSTFVRKWWFTIIFALFLLVCAILVTLGFSSVVKLVVDSQIVLKPGGKSYTLWSKPPVEPFIKIYIYNVTNADEFLNNGSKAILSELGPYVYSETWEKKNITENENGTLSFYQHKLYEFRSDLSNGDENDVVIVPNIPMLSATSQSKHAARFLRLAMASIMDILKIKPFVEVSVGQLLWGYEDPLLKLAKDVVPKEQKLPYEEFGLFYGKNDTLKDHVTVFSGVSDISKYGIIEKYNGMTHLPHWLTESCNRLNGSDGSIFPPHITEETSLYVYDKDLCRLLPLKFEKEIATKTGLRKYRFTPPEDVFDDVESNPKNKCFCPTGPPTCAPKGLFNVSLCQYDSPIMISFPHFYLGDDVYRTAVEGISEPNKESHQMYIDVQPDFGTTLQARARFQINLAVSQVLDIKQVANFPDIVFPILWFEEGIDDLPEDVTNLMFFATSIPPKARIVLMILLFTLSALILVTAIFCLIRSSSRQSTLNLEGSNYLATAKVDLDRKNVKKEENKC